MYNAFVLWAVVTTVSFVVGWSYITYASLKETDYPKQD